MKKLRLELDSISVETFLPEAVPTHTRRTVFGYDATEDLCGPGSSGVIGACYTWYVVTECVYSTNPWDGDNCTPVCLTADIVCPSRAEGCETGVCYTDICG